MIYLLKILNPSLSTVKILSEFISIIWNTQYYGPGEFELVVQYDADVWSVLQPGNYIVKNNTKEIAVIEKVAYSFSPDEGGTITATGRMAISLLDRRLIYNWANYSPEIIGYCPVNGRLETYARQTVSDQAIEPLAGGTARQITNLVLGTRYEYTETSDGARISTHLNLYNAVTGMLATKYLSHRIIYDASVNKLKYEVQKGTDRSATMVFSRNLQNLLSFSYEVDKSELKTIAYVGGEGEGLAQFVTGAAINGGGTGLNRREIYYAADSDKQEGISNANYSAILVSEAKQNAKDYATIKSVEAEIDLVNSGYEFGVDYNVGDIILIKDIVDFKPRITTVIESQSADGYKIDVEFNEDAPEEEEE